MIKESMKRYGYRVSIILLTLTFSVANIIQVPYYFYLRPPHAIYIGITHWYEDYFFYLSQLTQGAMGNWLVVNNFTTESLPPTISWTFNLLLGKIGALLTLSPWVTFDGAVFLLSILYILLVYKAIRLLFPNDRKLRLAAFLIALTCDSFFTIQAVAGKITFVPYSYFYNYTAAFNRLGGVPHLILQSILSLLMVLLFARLAEEAIHSTYDALKRIIRLALGSACCTVALFVINPVYVFIDGLVLAVSSILLVALNRKVLLSLRLFFSMLLIFLPTIPLLAIQLQTFSHPFYQYFRMWEASIPPINIPTFLLTSGILTILVPLGIAPFLKNANPLRITGAVFALLPILLYFSPLPRLLTIPSFRILQPPAYVFLAAMGIEGIRLVSHALHIIVKVRTTRVFSTLTVLVLILQLPLLWQELYAKTHDYVLNSPMNYVDHDIYDALLFLRSLPQGKNALATGNLELLVPVISGKTVYSGHRSLTYEYEQKIAHVASFYYLLYSANEAQAFLSDNNIGYILWSREYNWQRALERYPFLHIMYENPRLVLFSVP